MAAAADLPCYTLISGAEDEELMSEQDMKNAFEKGNLDQKVLGLKHCIKGMLKGEKYPMLLMFIIRFLLPMKDHIIKKLLLIYFEIVPKTAEGKLLPQMILVCDAYRKVCLDRQMAFHI
jgi:coatomer subunit beta